MRFSERIGIKETKIDIQLNEIDVDLANGLWNVFNLFYIKKLEQEIYDSISLTKFENFIHSLWFSFFKEPLDTIPSNKYRIIEILRKRFFNSFWYDKYDFIEFIAKNPGPINNYEFIDSCNLILKRELSGYRFIENELVPITDENQINQIQEAINQTSINSLTGVNIHLNTALIKLSDRKTPDYRNSIKESISAVEAICQVISGDKKAELGKSLKIIKDKIDLHSALEQGFTKLYGYTSDGDGIRHSLHEESTSDIEDAIYMLTSCSAFINYLIVKANKAGITFN